MNVGAGRVQSEGMWGEPVVWRGEKTETARVAAVSTALRTGRFPGAYASAVLQQWDSIVLLVNYSLTVHSELFQVPAHFVHHLAQTANVYVDIAAVSQRLKHV